MDAFGHSIANTRLFADFGFDAVFMSRADREDRKQKEKKASLEFVWRPFSKHFGSRKQIFASLFKDHYCWIPGFDNQKDSIETDETLTSFNAYDKMLHFVKYAHEIYPYHRS